MKRLLFTGMVFLLIVACATQQTTNIDKPRPTSKNDTVRIANDSLQYEIIIIEPGFDAWLASTARPRHFYSLTYLENKNYFLVSEWNRRVLDPHRYNPDLYGMRIDYQSNIHYGLEVNYLLYNYFVYFQNRYRQRL